MNLKRNSASAIVLTFSRNAFFFNETLQGLYLKKLVFQVRLQNFKIKHDRFFLFRVFHLFQMNELQEKNVVDYKITINNFLSYWDYRMIIISRYDFKFQIQSLEIVFRPFYNPFLDRV
uniref:Uncharacterized protein n=1 Tax=Rhizophagus irregularis (strain DAOM 181602 / DAOM 197198 / MUCL 43194) TaxID=747089 RepID=U9TL99_RHIID